MTDTTQAELVKMLGESGARVVAETAERLAEGGADALAKELLVTLSTAMSAAKHAHALERRVAALEAIARTSARAGAL